VKESGMDPVGARQRTVEWEVPVAVARTVRGLSGLDYSTAMQEGRISRPPVAALVGFTIAEIAEGTPRRCPRPSLWHATTTCLVFAMPETEWPARSLRA
jgi:hypothetical protein